MIGHILCLSVCRQVFLGCEQGGILQGQLRTQVNILFTAVSGYDVIFSTVGLIWLSSSQLFREPPYVRAAHTS